MRCVGELVRWTDAAQDLFNVHGERFEWYFGIYPKLESLIAFQLESRFVERKAENHFRWN